VEQDAIGTIGGTEEEEEGAQLERMTCPPPGGVALDRPRQKCAILVAVRLRLCHAGVERNFILV
jgi:hypothetical protein